MVGDLRKFAPLLVLAVAILMVFVAIRGSGNGAPALPERPTDAGQNQGKQDAAQSGQDQGQKQGSGQSSSEQNL